MVDAVPNIPVPVPAVSNQDIKVATPDLIQFGDDQVPVEYMTDLLFEQVGAQEIMSISRNDIVNGQPVLYRPIKNIPQINASFNPLNIFASIDDNNAYFKNFPIAFEDRVPELGADTAKSEVIDVAYIDKTNGNVVLQIINMLVDDQVEVQVLSSGEPVGDIIY